MNQFEDLKLQARSSLFIRIRLIAIFGRQDIQREQRTLGSSSEWVEILSFRSIDLPIFLHSEMVLQLDKQVNKKEPKLEESPEILQPAVCWILP